MKYIVFTNRKNQKTVLIFPNHIPHVNMTGMTAHVVSKSRGYPCIHIGEPTSAGFAIIVGNGAVRVHGRSESLNLDCDPEDASLIWHEFERSEHSQSITITE